MNFNNFNNYGKNKYYCTKFNNNSNSNNFCNNIYPYNNCNNKYNSSLNNLFEVENFLCNISAICKGIKFYKFFK